MNIIICVDNTEIFDKIKNEINKESSNIIVLDVDSQDEVRLENAIKKIHSLYEKNEEEVILIKSESGLHRVKQSEIYYFTIVKRKLNICLTDGRELRAWKTIKEFQEELNDSIFAKINSGCVVNIKYIKELEEQEVLLLNGEKLAVSRQELKGVKTKMLKYWGEK